MWFYYIILTLIIYTFKIASYPIERDHFNEILFLLNRTQIRPGQESTSLLSHHYKVMASSKPSDTSKAQIP